MLTLMTHSCLRVQHQIKLSGLLTSRIYLANVTFVSRFKPVHAVRWRRLRTHSDKQLLPVPPGSSRSTNASHVTCVFVHGDASRLREDFRWRRPTHLPGKRSIGRRRIAETRRQVRLQDPSWTSGRPGRTGTVEAERIRRGRRVSLRGSACCSPAGHRGTLRGLPALRVTCTGCAGSRQVKRCHNKSRSVVLLRSVRAEDELLNHPHAHAHSFPRNS